ncbi:periplasmic binding protein [Methanocaldococcus sp. FS406-22]|uniref:ABC transporter substrate-binding protein n=1 Tax=Methanocaldococcus sp. (strain FS406-22) TaxID=644281 RepID=UPI0001C4E195|nr:ABC transporter substrate-binding protein [Methanocaldococcus sp. FS406-22]ADC69961.1 periplasmic binding protein [Methanocaldococcus sp. FS406-22]
MRKFFLLSILMIGVIVAFAGCVEESKTTTQPQQTTQSEPQKAETQVKLGINVVRYAETFKLYPHWDDGYCVVVDSVGNKFVLVEGNAKAPNIPDAKVIKVPVKRIVTDFYCPIISTADILNAYHETIVGAPKYAIEDSPKLKELFEEGKVVNIGSPGRGVNYELIANLTPDIVFLSDWSSEDKVEEKLKELGITVSRFYTYKEPTYMGRIEWIKFAAAFWGSDAYRKANEWFKNVVKVREGILKKVQNTTTEPTVVIFGWSKTLNMPGIYGNDHYYSKMISEFKGKNIFADYNGTYQRIDKETFYERAINADVAILIWFYGDVKTKEDLLKINPEFAKFKAFKTGRFYVSHPDYYVWEARDPAGYMMDFAKMLHPELFGGDDDLKYFYKIK